MQQKFGKVCQAQEQRISLLLDYQEKLLKERLHLLQERERLLLQRRDLLEVQMQCRRLIEHCARWKLP